MTNRIDSATHGAGTFPAKLMFFRDRATRLVHYFHPSPLAGDEGAFPVAQRTMGTFKNW